MDAQNARRDVGETLEVRRATSERRYVCTGFVAAGGSWPRFRIVALGGETYLHVQTLRCSTEARAGNEEALGRRCELLGGEVTAGKGKVQAKGRCRQREGAGKGKVQAKGRCRQREGAGGCVNPRSGTAGNYWWLRAVACSCRGMVEAFTPARHEDKWVKMVLQINLATIRCIFTIQLQQNPEA
jgi:hypothetical protein